MNEIFQNSLFFGTTVTLATYFLGVRIKKKWNFGLFNPLLIAIVLTIIILLIFRIDYSVYAEGAKYISYLLTPATVCLAIPLYEKLDMLKKYPVAILLGILAGTLTSLVTILLLCLLFRLDHSYYVTLLPKSITTAIGMGVSEELGGFAPLTVAVIVITGVLGNISASTVCRIFRITDPVAKGVAIGTASHAIGTSRALELGEVEGAMSGLSLAVAGLLTVVLANVFAPLL